MNVTMTDEGYLENATKETPSILATEGHNLALWIFVFVTAIFGIVANSLTFIVIAKKKKLRKAPFNILLLGLCVSDFMSASVSPIMYYRNGLVPRSYDLHVWTCKLAVTVDHWTTIATVHHILAVVIYRISAIQFPHALKKFTSTHAAITVCLIWIESFATSAWHPLFGMTIKSLFNFRRTCFLNKRWSEYAMYYSRFYLPFGLFLPILLIIVLSIWTLVLIEKRRREKRQANADADLRKENKAFLQIAFIVGSFMFGYAPEIVFRISIMQGVDLKATVYLYDLFRLLFLRISESLNPIFYNLCSSTLKTASIKLLKKLCWCKEELPAQ